MVKNQQEDDSTYKKMKEVKEKNNQLPKNIQRYREGYKSYSIITYKMKVTERLQVVTIITEGYNSFCMERDLLLY